MHHRCPPASFGPSSKTCPRCEWQRAQRTSVRTIPCELSATSSTASGETLCVKLGQPLPEWYFARLSKRTLAQAAQWKKPSSSVSTYLPDNVRNDVNARNTADGLLESRNWHDA